MRKTWTFLSVICLAVTGATLGFLLKLPIGILIGSFLFIGIAQIKGLQAAPMSRKTKQYIQMIIGGFVGLNFNSELLPYIVHLIVPGLIAVVMHLMFALLFSYMVVKLFKLDWVTTLCGSIPAGMSEISTTAAELEADVAIVMLMHLFRLSLLILVLPLIIQAIL